MKASSTIAIAAMSIIVTAACTNAERKDAAPERSPAGDQRAEVASWEQTTRDWPDTSRSAAQEMVAKYGVPDEITATQLTWGRRGPWKKSILSREETPHEWPSKHNDVLEQIIDFRIPADKVDELTSFDGSVMTERTKGELSARCAGESANFLAVNLAREIIGGSRTVDDARRFYEAASREKKDGKTPEYMQKLMFEPPVGGTGDVDRPALTAF